MQSSKARQLCHKYLCLVGALVLAAWLAATVQADDEQRLNVLLITADDAGLQLSCYGDKTIQTPHLDRLADQGVKFDVAYIAQASCSPSRSAMFTGLYPHSTGQFGLVNAGYSLHEHLRDATLPNLLKKAGYRTGLIGKLHVAPESSFAFDDRPARVNTRQVRQVAERAAAFFEKSDDQPFFLMVNYSDPHVLRPPQAQQRAGDQFFPAQIDDVPPDPITAADAAPWPFQQINEPLQVERVANYYNCIKRLDAGVGMLLEQLEQSGKADRTLVIFLSDHGPPFARGKTTCYEAGLRVPFIVRWPGVSKQGLSSSAMVSSVDIVPTVLDAVGVPLPGKLHGRSLRAVVSEADVSWREYLAGEFHCHGAQPFYPRRAIRDDRYKLIHNLRAGAAKPSNGIDGDPAYRLSQQSHYDSTVTRTAFDTFADPPEFELYDLQNDPNEFQNLAGQSDVAETQQRLIGSLQAWRRETDDPLLSEAFLKSVVDRGSDALR
jgi:N-sulfoglucosamine sulfohydrolase